MLPAVVVIIVIGSIVLAVLRGKKIKQAREDEERRRQARMQQPAPRVRPPEPRTAPQPKQDPFPTYRPDPFADAQGESTGTLSPAQLNEWLIDFVMAEQAGVRRPEKKSESVFKRYLLRNDFSFRELRKRSGYAPQNELHTDRVLPKNKPNVLTTVLRNTYTVKTRSEEKSFDWLVNNKQYPIILPEEKKNPINRQTFEGFYKGKS